MIDIRHIFEQLLRRTLVNQANVLFETVPHYNYFKYPLTQTLKRLKQIEPAAPKLLHFSRIL